MTLFKTLYKNSCHARPRFRGLTMGWFGGEVLADGKLISPETWEPDVFSLTLQDAGIALREQLPSNTGRSGAVLRLRSKAQPWTADRSRVLSCFVVASGGHGRFPESRTVGPILPSPIRLKSTEKIRLERPSSERQAPKQAPRLISGAAKTVHPPRPLNCTEAPSQLKPAPFTGQRALTRVDAAFVRGRW